MASKHQGTAQRRLCKQTVLLSTSMWLHRKHQAIKVSSLKLNHKNLGKRHQSIIRVLITVKDFSLYFYFNSNSTKSRVPSRARNFQVSLDLQCATCWSRNLPSHRAFSAPRKTGNQPHFITRGLVSPPTLQDTSRKARNVCVTPYVPKAI